MPLKPIVLKGEQKRVLFLQTTEPIQIKGVAGSGKTTVALYRAKHLLETQQHLFQDSSVAIFTYNKTLTSYINALKPVISGGYQKDSDERVKRSHDGLNVQVYNFDKYAYHFLKSKGINAFVNRRQIEEWKTNTIKKGIEVTLIQFPKSKVLQRSIDFFVEEFAWIKGKHFITEAEYLSSKRTGRGNTAFNETTRQRIWKVYDHYLKEAKRLSIIDFDDYPALMLSVIENDSFYIPPFTHIIIDEAQDLSKAQILALSKLVSNETKSITLIADAAQKIYKKGFTWTEVGIEVRGARTLSLKKNYRNTEAILKAAQSLLDNEPDKTEFTDAEPSRLGGVKPIWGKFKSNSEQVHYLINQLRFLHKPGIHTVILHRDWAGMHEISNDLTKAGINNEIITGGPALNFENDYIKICTLSSVKGLEFDNVFILDMNEGVIPYPMTYEDQDEIDTHISTERRLLYTAMTRAKERLFLLSSGNASQYLNEINPSLIATLDDPQSPLYTRDNLPF